MPLLINPDNDIYLSESILNLFYFEVKIFNTKIISGLVFNILF